jgi:hypothetical protein
MSSNKIFCIGLPRTGTTSLGAALKYAGYKHLSYNLNHHNLYKKNDITALMKIINKYESFDDKPWCHLYKDIYKNFPDSKFILTMRQDAETWYKSICNLHDILGPRKGVIPPYNRKHELINEYLSHNKDVTSFFKNKNNLLIMSFENGDGWKELCAFIEKPIPEIPFPHAHKTPSYLIGLPKSLKFIIRLPLIGQLIRKTRRFAKNIINSNR